MKRLKPVRMLISALVLPALFASSALAGYSGGPDNSIYSRTDAARYIYAYTISPNRAYYDYSVDGQPGDCTNFISQVVHAGGLPMTPPVSKPTNNDWYYYGPDWGRGRSSSWTTARNFRYYWAEIGGVGAKKAYAQKVFSAAAFAISDLWYQIYLYLEPGDIIQYANAGGVTYHSQAVHRTAYERGEYKVSVGQHTGNGWRNLRNYVLSLPPDTTVCLMKIKTPAFSPGIPEDYSALSPGKLAELEQTLFASVPADAAAENEKWATLRAVKEALVARVEKDEGAAAFRARVSRELLLEFAGNRLESNQNIIGCLSYQPDFLSMRKEDRLAILLCRAENARIRAFLEKLSAQGSGGTPDALWHSYWDEVVRQAPPPYVTTTHE